MDVKHGDELVCLKRKDVGLLLAAALALLERLQRTHPTSARVWDLGQACTAAEAALLGEDTEGPGPR